MANYTINLFQIEDRKDFVLFDFEYDYYLPINQKAFEQKFFDKYFELEIGYETLGVFKRKLKQKLQLKAPYYKQLYATELASKDINFLLNKDLTETFERELDSSNNANTNTKQNDNTTNNNQSASDNTNVFSDTPMNNINNINNFMTNATKDNNTSNSSDTTISTSNLDNITESVMKNKEVTKLISQGNIGITSSAELLEKWRSVIINLDEIILNDLRSLFLKIY